MSKHCPSHRHSRPAEMRPRHLRPCPLLPGLLYLLTLPSAVNAGPTGDLSRQWLEAVQLNTLAVIADQLRTMENVNITTANGKTALMAAAAGGSSELAQTLIAAGAKVTAENRSSGTALMYAAAAGDGKTIALLIDQGARVDHQASNGWSALMMAVAKGHRHACRVLLDYGAKVDLPDMYGWTPLMRAVYEGRVQIVRQLLSAPDIDLEKRNVRGQTALHLAVIGRQDELVNDLVDRGADLSQEDFQGRSALQLALVTKNKVLAEMLTGVMQQIDAH